MRSSHRFYLDTQRLSQEKCQNETVSFTVTHRFELCKSTSFSSKSKEPNSFFSYSGNFLDDFYDDFRWLEVRSLWNEAFDWRIQNKHNLTTEVLSRKKLATMPIYGRERVMRFALVTRDAREAKDARFLVVSNGFLMAVVLVAFW